MKSLVSITRLVSALFALAVVCNVAAEIPELKLVNAYPNLNFKRPLWLEQLPDGRTFLLEQRGKILILPKNAKGKKTETFFDIEARKPYVKDEEGLLGMAFHPQFAKNGKFYVFYSAHKPLRSVVSEFRVGKGGTIDLTTERVLLTIQRPFWNHDGGCILFGPDGKLYITHGDGGSREDPNDNAQNLATLRGTILRIDVDAPTTARRYGIPKDNPFVNRKGARGEIWAYGLRNVWRMSFDRATGELWAADVGQDYWEEVNLIVKGGNYGWRTREGFHESPSKKGGLLTTKHKNPEKLLDPVIEYPHTPGLAKKSKFDQHGHGLSITGGYVYRGKKIPALRGAYVYGDYRTGTVWAFKQTGGKVTEYKQVVKPNALRLIASFGEDNAGEQYLLGLGGKVYRLEAK
jgi:quinoprotein glucose dehydrogenase